MPVINGIGHGPHTAQKQQDFAGLVRMLGQMTRNKIHEYKSPYFQYIDLNAGSGWYEGMEGSPLVFVRVAEEIALPYQATLVELDEANANRLRRHLAHRADHCRVIRGDNARILPTLIDPAAPKWTFGLVYADPTGCQFPWAALEAFARAHPIIDFLLYAQAANYKRAVAAFHWPRLVEQIQQIPKSNWLVRRPSGRQQYTFFLGMNRPNLPRWEGRGFFDARSDEGRAIVEKLTFTATESAIDQGDLFV